MLTSAVILLVVERRLVGALEPWLCYLSRMGKHPPHFDPRSKKMTFKLKQQETSIGKSPATTARFNRLSWLRSWIF